MNSNTAKLRRISDMRIEVAKELAPDATVDEQRDAWQSLATRTGSALLAMQAAISVIADCIDYQSEENRRARADMAEATTSFVEAKTAIMAIMAILARINEQKPGG